MAATTQRAEMSIRDAIRECERAAAAAEQAAHELRAISGRIEDKVEDPTVVARIVATLRACRPIAEADFQLCADIDDAIRVLEATS